MIPKIYLKQGKEESLERRHPWIFSGAIAHAEGDPEEGHVVDVYTSDGNFVARGHCQVGSIAVRVLTFRQEEINGAWWRRRIAEAYNLRRALGLAGNQQTTCYRLIHGEGDNLPGLVVDIYGHTAVVQCHSVGMYLSRTEIAAALAEVLGDKLDAVYDKSAQTVPFNAGLDPVDGYLHGGPTAQPLEVLENGNRFLVNWEKGQKTGFFIDQRENRELVRRYATDRRVLNTFCYTGGFSVYALAGGAAAVDSVDSSQYAVELSARNVALNFGPDAQHHAIAADAMDFIRDMDDTYDMVILDPPAFAKHHKVLGNAMQGYRRLNARAIQKIKSGGILFTFSCSPGREPRGIPHHGILGRGNRRT